MNKRIHVYYSGRVHGVGFRFTVDRIATDLELFGWVKNLADNRVELVAEGQEESLKKLISKIDDSFPNYITQKNINWMPSSGEFNSFEIRFF